MTQIEFINELEQALRGNVSEKVIRDNVAYYRGYIQEQVAAGRTSEDVIGSLGSPRLIAKTIIDTTENQTEDTREAKEPGSSLGAAMDWIKEKAQTGWVVKTVIAIVGVLIAFAVLGLVFRLIGLLFKPAVVILALAVVYYLIDGIRKKKF